jgi:hypothetical protein
LTERERERERETEMETERDISSPAKKTTKTSLQTPNKAQIRLVLRYLISVRNQPTVEKRLNISRKITSGSQILIQDILFMYEKCLNMYELLR